MRFGIGWLMSMLIVKEVTLLQHVMLVFNYLNSVFYLFNLYLLSIYVVI